MSSLLLDLALDLTRQTGRAPTLAELADASGLSRATVYRTFANQQGLLEQLQARGAALPEPSEAVFEAVRAVILERGLDGCSLEAVARRAGVSVATLHRRYQGRDALLFAFFDQLAPRTEAWRLPARGCAEDALAGFAETLSAWIAEDGALLAAALSSAPQTRRRLQSLRATGVGTQEALAEWLRLRGEASGRPVCEPLRAARAFLGAVLGLSAAGPLSEESARWWARAFLRGLELA